MITVLYLITVGTWYDLSSFDGEFQIDNCGAEKIRIEQRFKVKAVCLTESDELIIVDRDIYRR
tara:strand:- start:582 stop:770 length:189 start_codon:yes stop_codon:yes gene_type:complete